MKSSQLRLHFNNNPVSSTPFHKHLGIVLDDNVGYEHYLNFVLKRVKKTICLLRKFQQSLPRKISNHNLQKQPSRGALIKRCSENMQKIYRRTPMPKCDFNKPFQNTFLYEHL